MPLQPTGPCVINTDGEILPVEGTTLIPPFTEEGIGTAIGAHRCADCDQYHLEYSTLCEPISDIIHAVTTAGSDGGTVLAKQLRPDVLHKWFTKNYYVIVHQLRDYAPSSASSARCRNRSVDKLWCPLPVHGHCFVTPVRQTAEYTEQLEHVTTEILPGVRSDSPIIDDEDEYRIAWMYLLLAGTQHNCHASAAIVAEWLTPSYAEYQHQPLPLRQYAVTGIAGIKEEIAIKRTTDIIHAIIDKLDL